MDGRSRILSYKFGSFQADILLRRLSRDGQPLPLTAKAFDTLAVLLANRGETVSKIDLMNAVWGETSVEENNLTQQISALRKVLGERARDHKFIVTVSGKGYCFVAPVKELSEAAAAGDSTVFAATASEANRKKRLRSQLIGSDTLFGGGLAVAYVFVVCFAVVLFGGQNSQPRPPSVAVLTFRSLDAGDEPLGAGLRDTLRARLGSIEDITVRPTAAGRSRTRRPRRGPQTACRRGTHGLDSARRGSRACRRRDGGHRGRARRLGRHVRRDVAEHFRTSGLDRERGRQSSPRLTYTGSAVGAVKPAVFDRPRSDISTHGGQRPLA